METCPSRLPPFTPVNPNPVSLSRPMDGSRLSRSLSCKIFWSSEGGGQGGDIKPIWTGRSAAVVLPTRGVFGTEDIGVVGDKGRSLETLFDRSIPRRLLPARPNEVSSGGGGVSAPSRSEIELNDMSRVAPEGERGRLAPKSPRKADTATEGGRGEAERGEAERREGAGEEGPGEAV